MKTILLTLLMMAPLASLQSAEPPLKPSTPADQRVISKWSEPRLKPGDPAPQLIAKEWIHGEPVAEFTKDTAYLVEFWDTPFGACDDNVEHLNALHQKFKDKGLIVIGQHVGQDSGSAQEDLTARRVALTQAANSRTYPVALDNANTPRGTMMETWMTAAGQDCLPCAFLIGKDGRIAWIGNPAEVTENKITYPAALDQRIEDLIAGKFDVPKAVSEFMADQRCSLRQAAADLLENESLSGKELDSAYELAVRANGGDFDTDEHQAGHLKVLARATFMKGEKEKAVELQERVIALMAGSTNDKADIARLQATLESYRAGNLPIVEKRNGAKSNVVTLKIGDLAPQLNCGEWLRGKPVTKFAKDKAYLIEFWATWCGPCVASIPHLNALHLKFKNKGLVVIGQNVEGENQTPVKAFVKKMTDKMTYAVALDNMNGLTQGAMAETWLQAAGQNAIPTAFLVGKDGRLAWIGHPNELTEKMIEEVLTDRNEASN